MKQSGMEQIVRQTTPSNFFRDPLVISITSPFFGLSRLTDGGITAIDKRRLGRGTDDLLFECARERLREGELITDGIGETNDSNEIFAGSSGED